jgi:hypothetical protein
MPMLATVDERTAERVARDVRDFGHGYIRVDREGRTEHVPADAVVVTGIDGRDRAERRTFE